MKRNNFQRRNITSVFLLLERLYLHEKCECVCSKSLPIGLKKGDLSFRVKKNVLALSYNNKNVFIVLQNKMIES